MRNKHTLVDEYYKKLEDNGWKGLRGDKMKINRGTARAILSVLMLFSIIFTVVFGGVFITEAEEQAWLDRIRDNPYLAYDIMGDGPNPPANWIEAAVRFQLVIVGAATLLMVERDSE